ncbi:LuxR C-terminal-related transcriptional regulator [Saccharopolyspora halophila]|uniref:LuxR C-terminal-related transcriptional regulator n=1 Tax=Saccharopolyspora halophila TaxID=405551 RepID=A0ABN3FM49_9PSEU
MVDEAVVDTCAGAGSLLVITGPLGIGKSELLDACAQRGRGNGLRVLRADCASHEREFEFAVVRQLLEPPFGAEPSAVQRPRKDHRASAEDGLRSRQRDPHRLIAEMSGEQPLLILVDDLQWADAASLTFLGRLAREVAGLPVTIAVTVLDGDPGAELAPVREIADAATRVLRPAHLSAAAVRTLVRGELGERADEAFVTACRGSSAGNPLFLMSMLFELKGAGRRPIGSEAEAVWSLRPSGLRERLFSCLSVQSPAVRGLVRTAAVLGESADAELVGRVAGLDESQHAEAVRSLCGLGLHTSESRLGPARSAVHAAVAELTTAGELEGIHLRAARALYGQGHPARDVARYLVEVPAPLDAWAIRVLRSGAEAELARGAPETAASYLRRALLDSSPDGPDRAGLLVELAAAERAFDSPASVRHVSQAVPMLATTRERAAAMARLSPMMLATSPAPVTDLIRGVVREFGPPQELSWTDRELVLRMEARRRYLTIEDPMGLADSVRRLHALGPNPPMDSPAERELLAVLLYAATITAEVGASEVARLANRVLEREPARSNHVHTGLPLLVNVLVGADSPENPAAWLERVRGHQQHQGDVVARTLLCTETGLVRMSTGKLDQALSVTREAIGLGGLGWEHGNSATLLAVAFLALETEDRELTERVLERGAATGNNMCVTAALRLLKGSAVSDRSELGPALQRILDLGQQLDRWGVRNPALCPWRGRAAMLQHRLGHAAEAQQLIEQEYELATSWGAPAAIGRALRTYAALSEEGEDFSLLKEAIKVLNGSANRIELARAHLLFGRRLRAAGKPGAETHLREARGIAGECGVQQLVDRVDGELGRHPSAASARGALLTPSEYQVALLARSGSTNQEIAWQAQVTSRMVEKHLTKIYRKLGIRGRAELADALRLPQDQASA